MGKSRSTCFDAQIADATISLVQYTILSFHRWITDYSPFDRIFASVLEDAMQYSIASEQQKIPLIIIEIFSGLAGVDVIELTRSVFRGEQTSTRIKQFNPVFYQNLQKHGAV
ncbi:MAG: hypothetical protein L3J11_07950 [Draconibacterium sp.]|nr:hypothetical protein [Draconibacterium sp.]